MPHQNRRNASRRPRRVLRDCQDIMAINLNGTSTLTHASWSRCARPRAHRQYWPRSSPSCMCARRTRRPIRRPNTACSAFPARSAAELGKDGCASTRIGPGLIGNAAQCTGARQQSGAGESLHRPHPRSAAPASRRTSSGLRSFSPPTCLLRSPASIVNGGWRVSDGLDHEQTGPSYTGWSRLPLLDGHDPAAMPI